MWRQWRIGNAVILLNLLVVEINYIANTNETVISNFIDCWNTEVGIIKKKKKMKWNMHENIERESYDVLQ